MSGKGFNSARAWAVARRFGVVSPAVLAEVAPTTVARAVQFCADAVAEGAMTIEQAHGQARYVTYRVAPPPKPVLAAVNLTRIWCALQTRPDWTVSELQFCCAVNRSQVKRYVAALAGAGYLRAQAGVVDPRRYQVDRARVAGPFAPALVRREGAWRLLDPETGALVPMILEAADAG